VEDIQREIGGERTRIAEAEETLEKAGKERAAFEPALSEARRLQEVCNRLDEAAAEWETVQELTRRELAEKDLLEQEMHALAYDPEERRRLEEEVAALEGAWKEQVAISDRLKRRPALARSIRETGERLEQLGEELAKTRREREGVGFDPGEHARLEGEFLKAEDRHRRYLQMKSGMERLSPLEERAASLAMQLQGAGEDLARMAAALGEVPFTPENLAEKEADLRSIQELAMRIAQQAAETTSDRVHLQQEERRLSDLLRKFESDRKEHDRIREEIELLEITREHLNGFTDHLLGVVRDQIQEETGHILSEITDGRYDTVILDDAFELLVHDLGGDFPVSRFSGGEQDDVAIALRIALSRYIAEMHELHDSTFLIFDEIFGSQDEERRGNIFRALRALEPYFPQIFLISHVTEVQGEFGNTLVVEAVSGSESRIRDLEGAPG
jgi:DNA repair exonuclease SbcCD ATPase subunit